MKSLKSSKIIKTLCFLFCMIFLFGTAANVVLGLLLTKSNLLYTDKDQLTEMAYEEIVEHYNQNDIRYYLQWTVMDVNDRETELYRTKFSRDKSNLSFVITDQNGETVLSNFLVNDKGLTFTNKIQIFEYDMPDYKEYFGENETYTTTLPEQQEHTTTPPESAENSPAEELTAEATSAGTAEEPTTAATLPVETTQPERTEHLILIDETGTDENAAPVRFKYIYYGESYNQDILEHCMKYYSSDYDWYCDYADMENGWMTFREDDFAISDNGVVYYKGLLEPTTEIMDFYNENAPHTDYDVTYTLPKTMTARDLFYYVEKLAGFAYGYIRHLVLLTVLFALASAVFFILLLVCAGNVKGEESPKAKGLHRFPYDIVCAVAAITIISVSFFLIDDYSYGGPVPLIIWITVLALSALLFIETTVVRIKAKTIGKNFFIVWFVKNIVRLCKIASENMNLLWKIAIIFGVTAIMEFIYSFLLCEESEFIFLWFVVKIIEIPLAVFLAVIWNRLQNGAKRLSEGNFTEKIDQKYLFGEFKKNAEYLNTIGDGVNRAVSERMKSESMKTELITNVSHDLKTPLTSIINYVDLLKGTNIRDEKALEYIDVIDRQSQKLKKLCVDVVDASKAATGNLQVTNERTALNVLLGQMAGEYEERLALRSLQLIREQPEHDVFIYADGRLLWRVFDNLMNNVCKYAMSGTRVYLTMTERDGRATVMFRNISGTALNISPEELTERFVRGDASRNTEGSGLGLSIAKSMTELMGGTFDITIDGDLFKVTLTFPTIN